MTTYETYVMMAMDNSVVSAEHKEPDGVIAEMLQYYTLPEMHESGLTLCRVLSDGICWLECLAEIEY